MTDPNSPEEIKKRAAQTLDESLKRIRTLDQPVRTKVKRDYSDPADELFRGDANSIFPRFKHHEDPRLRSQLQALQKKRDDRIKESESFLGGKDWRTVYDTWKGQGLWDQFTQERTPELRAAIDIKQAHEAYETFKSKMLRDANEQREDVVDYIEDLKGDFDQGDLETTFGSLPIDQKFNTALQVTRDVDKAFQMTIGRVPDLETKIRFYAKLTGQPLEVVRDNLDVIEQNALYLDKRKLLKHAPNLIDYASNPNNFAQISDILPHLARLESLSQSRHGNIFQDIGSGFQSVASLKDLATKGLTVREDLYGGMMKFLGETFDEPELVKAGQFMQDEGVKIRDEAQRKLESRVELTPETPGFRKFTYNLTGGLTQILGSIGLGFVNPAIPLSLIGTAEGGSVYGDLRDQDVGIGTALFSGLGVGMVNAWLEKLQIQAGTRVLTREARSATQIFREGLNNFLQETAQNIVSTTGTMLGETQVKDKTGSQVAEEFGESIVQGAYEGMIAGISVMLLGAPGAIGSFSRYKSAAKERKDFKESEEIIIEAKKVKGNTEHGDDSIAAAANAMTSNEAIGVEVEHLEAYFQTLSPEAADQAREDFRKKMGITEKQWEEAFKRHKDGKPAIVVFRKGDYLVRFSGTELANTIRKDLIMPGSNSEEEVEINKQALFDKVVNLYEAWTEIQQDKFKEADPARIQEMELVLRRDGGYNAEEARFIVDHFRSGANRFSRQTGESMEEWAARVNPVMQFVQGKFQIISAKDAQGVVTQVEDIDLKPRDLNKDVTKESLASELAIIPAQSLGSSDAIQNKVDQLEEQLQNDIARFEQRMEEKAEEQGRELEDIQLSDQLKRRQEALEVLKAKAMSDERLEAMAKSGNAAAQKEVTHRLAVRGQLAARGPVQVGVLDQVRFAQSEEARKFPPRADKDGVRKNALGIEIRKEGKKFVLYDPQGNKVNEFNKLKDAVEDSARVADKVVESIRQQAREGLFQSVPLRTGEESLEKYGITKENAGKITKRQVALALHAWAREKNGDDIGKDNFSDEAKDKISDWMVEELIFETLPENITRSAAGWYSTNYEAAQEILGAIFPEFVGEEGFSDSSLKGLAKLGNSENARNFFTSIMAASSQGLKPEGNFELATTLWEGFRKTGQIPKGTAWGKSKPAIEANLAKMQEMLDTLGPEKMVEFLMQEKTISQLIATDLRIQLSEKLMSKYGNTELIDDLNEDNLKELRQLVVEELLDDIKIAAVAKHGVDKAEELLEKATNNKKRLALAKQLKVEILEEETSEYEMDQTLPMAAVVYGAKIGAFYANLMGAEGYLTMDMWWTRTFNRYTGEIVSHATPGRLNDFRDELIKAGRLEKGASIEDAILHSKEYHDSFWKKFNGPKGATKKERAASKKTVLPIERMGKDIYQQEVMGLDDTPGSKPRRTFMIQTVTEAQRKIQERAAEMEEGPQKEALKNISIADVQALLWYYEKRLFAELGVRPSGDIAYDQAANIAVAKRTGREIPESDDQRGRSASPEDGPSALVGPNGQLLEVQRGEPGQDEERFAQTVGAFLDTALGRIPENKEQIKTNIMESLGVKEDDLAFVHPELIAAVTQARSRFFSLEEAPQFTEEIDANLALIEFKERLNRIVKGDQKVSEFNFIQGPGFALGFFYESGEFADIVRKSRLVMYDDLHGTVVVGLTEADVESEIQQAIEETPGNNFWPDFLRTAERVLPDQEAPDVFRSVEKGDPGKAHKVLGETEFLQPGQRARTGQVVTDATALMSIYRPDADVSTVVHEQAHVFIEELKKMVELGVADEELTDAWLSLVEFAGGEITETGHEANVEVIEKIVRLYEAYVMRGKAPSKELTGAFAFFAKNMRNSYRTRRRLATELEELNDDVVDAFNMMLASETQLEEAAAYYNMQAAVSELVKEEDAAKAERERKRQEAQEKAEAEEARVAGLDAEERLKEAERKMLEERERLIQKRAEKLLAIYIRQRGTKVEMKKVLRERVSDTPVFAAMDEIKELGGVNLGRTNKDLAQAAADIHGDKLFNNDSEVSLQEVARNHGFSNGADLLKTMAITKTKKEEIEKLLEQELAEQLEEFREQIVKMEDHLGDEEMHNDFTLDFLLADIDFLVEKIGQDKERGILAAEKKALQDFAMQLLTQDRNARDAAQYGKYARAEAKWGRIAFKEAAAGNAEAALAARRKQVFYHALVQASFQVRTEKAKIMRRMNSNRLVEMNGVASNYAHVVQDIVWTWKLHKAARKPEGWTEGQLLLPDTGLAPASEKQENDQKLLRFLPDLEAILPEWMLRKQLPADYKNINDLTFDQIKELDAIISWLLSQGRGALDTLAEAEYATIEEMAQTSIDLMDTLTDFVRKGKLDSHNRLIELKRAVAAMTIMPQFLLEEADGSPLLKGGQIGVMHKMFNKVAGAQDDFDGRIADLWRGTDKRMGLEEAFRILGKEKDRIERKFGKTRYDVIGPDGNAIDTFEKKESAKSRADQLNKGETTKDSDFVVRKNKRHTFTIGDAIPVPQALIDAGRAVWDFDTLLAVALNLGNDANIHALMSSEYGFTMEQLEAIKTLFSKDGWKAIQGIWNTIDSQFKDLSEQVLKITNKEMVKEPSTPFSVTLEGGEVIAMEGGYYPLIFDPAINMAAATSAERESAIAMARMQSVFRATGKLNKGMTIDRLRDEKTGEALSQRPPLLSTGIIFTHLKDVTRLITHGKILQEVDQVTRHAGWKAKFVEKFGKDNYKQLRRWINYQARPERKIDDPISALLEGGRQATSVAILGAKLITGLKQRLSLINSIEAMSKAGKGNGMKWLAEGFKAVGFKAGATGAQTQEILDWVHILSPMMKNRARTFDRDIRDSTRKFKPISRWERQVIEREGKDPIVIDRDTIAEAAFWWIKVNDQAAVYPIWIGAYSQAMAGEAAGVDPETMTEEEAQDKAAEYADTIIRMSQPAGGPADLSALQRAEGAVRIFLLALTWRLKAGNRMMWYARAVKDGVLDPKELVRHFFVEWTLPAYATMVIPGLFYDDEDKPEWWEWIIRPGVDAISWIPIISNVSDTIRFGEQGVPAFEGFNRIARTWNKTKGEKYMEASMEFIHAMEWWTRIPLSTPFRDADKIGKRITGESFLEELK